MQVFFRTYFIYNFMVLKIEFNYSNNMQMDFREVLTVLLLLYHAITFTDPNTGNEMGRCRHDKVSKTGNYTIVLTYVMKIYIYHLALLSFAFNPDMTVLFSDWILVGIATIGVLISQYAYFTLGRFYTFQLGIRKDHYLVTKGPYRYIMHPGYLGQFILTVSSILFFRVNIIVTIIMLTITVYRVYWRITKEEEMLSNNFNNYTWSEYCSARWHLIPLIW